MPRPALKTLTFTHPQHFYDNFPNHLPYEFRTNPAVCLDEALKKSPSLFPWEAAPLHLSKNWKTSYLDAMHPEDRSRSGITILAHHYFLNTYLPSLFPPKKTDESTLKKIFAKLPLRRSTNELTSIAIKELWQITKGFYSPESIQKKVRAFIKSSRKPPSVSLIARWSDEDDCRLLRALKREAPFLFRNLKEQIKTSIRDNDPEWPWNGQIPWSRVKKSDFSDPAKKKTQLKHRFINHTLPIAILKQSPTPPDLLSDWLKKYVEERKEVSWLNASRDFFMESGYFMNGGQMKAAYIKAIKV